MEAMDNTIDRTFESANRVYGVDGIAPTVNTCGGGGLQAKIMEVRKLNSKTQTVAIRMVRTDEGKRLRKAYEAHEITHGFNEHRKAEPRTDGVCNTLSTVQKDNYLVETKPVAMKGRYTDGGSTFQHLEVQTDNVSNALTTVQKNSLVLKTDAGLKEVPRQFERFVYEIDGELYLIRIRKLTPRECWRLMGFSDSDYNKAAKVNSHTQLYKQAGNSIVKNVLVQVFGQMFQPKSNVELLKKKTCKQEENGDETDIIQYRDGARVCDADEFAAAQKCAGGFKKVNTQEIYVKMLTDIDADIANYSAMRDRLAAQLDSSSYTPDRFSGERKLAMYDELILDLRERRCDVERMMKE